MGKKKIEVTSIWMFFRRKDASDNTRKTGSMDFLDVAAVLWGAFSRE